MSPRSRQAGALSRDEVVEASIAVARAKGLEGLTMRAVATALDVTPMALYHYVEGKDELVQLVVEAVTRGRRELVLGPLGWEISLRDHLVSLWEEMAQYPGLGARLIEQPMLGVTEHTMLEGVRFLEAAGFPAREARLGWSFALTWLHGRLSVDARLRNEARPPRIGGLRARDYARYGAEAVVAGLRAMLDQADAPRGSDA